MRLPSSATTRSASPRNRSRSPTSGRWPDTEDQQPRHRVVAAAVLVGQLADAQARAQFGHRHQAVELPHAVRPLRGPGVGLGGGLQLAGDGFEQVARRHQALHHAVLVDHEHQPRGARAELLEQLHAGQRLGHEDRRLRRLLDGALVRRAQRQQLRHADDAHHVVQRAAAHRIPGMDLVAHRVGRHLLQGLRDGVGGLQPLDVGARHHQRAEPPVVEVEHVAHHLVLVHLDHAGVDALLQAGRDLLLGHRAGRVQVDAQQLERRGGGARQQQHEGLGGARRACASAAPRSAPPARDRAGRCAWAPARRR